MATKIFLNLAVDDLNKSVEFFTKLGYTFNLQFTSEQATCMIISDTIYVMLLTKPFFQSFTTKKQLVDTSKEFEVSICISAESKEEVDAIVKKAEAAGATIPDAATDHGWMYQHSFDDLDGHHWEYAWMDPAGPPQG